MKDKAIQVQDLHKNFEDVYAVQGVSFDVQAGELFSLLGPNGAGKSTIISMLACLLEPTKGDALVMGHSILREPMAALTAIGWRRIECPITNASPCVGSSRQASIEMMVLLPAPLGPSRLNISPACTSKLTPCTA